MSVFNSGHYCNMGRWPTPSTNLGHSRSIFLTIYNFSCEIFVALHHCSLLVSSEWAGANYTPNQLTTLPGYGQEWIYIPDENGDPQKIYLTPDLGLNNDTASIATNLTNRFFRKRTEELLNFLVTFDLYTK